MFSKSKNNNRIKYFSGLFLTIGLIFAFPSISLAGPINASDLISLTNKKRVEINLNELIPSHKLTQAAYEKAKDVIANGYFAHTTPEGKPFYHWIEENGYNYLYAGENLAIDFASSEGVVQAWMDSPLHKANILNANYTDIGLVAMRGDWNGKSTTVVVQMFGSLLSDSPTVLGLTLENLSRDLSLRRDSLETLAADLVMLPSLAGRKYFDVIVRPSKDTDINVTNPAIANIESSPITKVAQSGIYKTLLKSETSCCQNDVTFALTEERNNARATTPVSYPSLTKLLANITIYKFSFPASSESAYTNILVAAFVSLLLLLAYEEKIKKEFTSVKKKI